MKKYIPIVILSLLSVILVIWINQRFAYHDLIFGEEVTRFEKFYFKEGDNKDWALPAFNDSNWKADTLLAHSIWWMRKEINLTAFPAKPGKIELMIILQGAYDVFWNGYKIGNNGRVGVEKLEEIPGDYQNVFIIPDSLVHYPGVNQLALRVSNFRAKMADMELPKVLVGSYPNTSRQPVIFAAFIFTISGVAFLMSVYFLNLFLTSYREWAYLIFAGLCFSFFYLMVIKNVNHIYYYAYPLHGDVVKITVLVTLLVTFLLPVFFLFFFDMKAKKNIISLWVILFLIMGLGYYLGYGITNYLWIISISFALLIIGLALYKKIDGSIPALIGIFPLTGYFYLGYLIILPGFITLLTAIFYSETLKVREQRIQHKRDLLHSNRLQTEILKQQIQPHFLMNTLTSLIDWLEEEPKQAPKLIHSLAEEYKILMNFAHKRSTTIREEIHLCRLHLTVMSFKRGVEYHLHTKNLNLGRQIPPAVFLTTIENGITHNHDVNGLIEFFIEEKHEGDNITYSIYSSDKKAKNGPEKTDGTGTKYIKARLQESYPEKWAFKSGAVQSGWVTEITFFGSNKLMLP